MKTYLLSLLFIGMYLSSSGQKNLSGHISDKSSGQALVNVGIYIPELRRGVLTDEQGHFTFDNLGDGIITLQFSGLGYKSKVETVNLSGERKDLHISMEPSTTELEEVTVTSNQVKLPGNIPFSANTVLKDDVVKYASPSVMGNLSYQPGVDKITIGNGIGKPVIRGLSFNQIMLYTQGTRIENQQWDDHHDLGLSDAGIENVEIVRGPAALIYGADAFGGALIFTDEKPAAPGKTIGDATLGFCSNTLGINGDIGVKKTYRNGVFYSLRAGANSQTSYLQGEDEDEVKQSGEEEEFAFNSKFLHLVGKGSAGISKKWGVSKLSYSYLLQQIGIIEDESMEVTIPGGKSEEEEQREREIEAPNQKVATHVISLENTFLMVKSKVNVNVAYQLNDREEYEPVIGNKKGELSIGLKLNATTYDVKWTSNAEKNFGVTIGSQGLFLKNENNGLESLVPNANVTDIAGYGLFRYDRSKLNLLGGLRFDMRSIDAESYEASEAEADTFIIISPNDTIARPETDFEKNYSPVSFSIGAAYHFSERFTAKLNAATGFSAPNYAQLGTFGKHEGTYRFERGRNDLAIEQNLEVDLGLSWKGESITISAGGYINKIKDYIYLVNTGDTMVRIRPSGTDSLPFYVYVQNDATISGGEIGLDVHPGSAKWFDLSLTYALINGTLDEGGDLPYIPAGKLIGEIKLRKNKIGIFSDTYFSLIVSNYMVQDKVAEYEIPTEGYTLLDVHLGAVFKWGKQKPTFDIYCTNLLNSGYYSHLSLVKNIGVRDMGRNIGFRLRMPFALGKDKPSPEK